MSKPAAAKLMVIGRRLQTRLRFARAGCGAGIGLVTLTRQVAGSDCVPCLGWWSADLTVDLVPAVYPSWQAPRGMVRCHTDRQGRDPCLPAFWRRSSPTAAAMAGLYSHHWGYGDQAGRLGWRGT